MSTSSASIADSDTSSATTPTSPTTTVSFSDDTQDEPMPWILHHILNPQCASELPLTIMFMFNSGQKPHSLRAAQTWWQLDRQGKLLTKTLSSLTDNGAWSNDVPEPAFTAQLETIPERESTQPVHPFDHFSMPENQQLLRKVRFVDAAPEKDKNLFDKYLSKDTDQDLAQLPYSFIRSFSLKAFPSDYEQADFSNALAGLDYFRDLEFTRRANLRSLGKLWGITEYNWKGSFTTNTISLQWYIKMQKEETLIAKWFASIYVGLRIWIMINELKQPGVSRREIMAMLNTLYPPVILSVPNDEISIRQLQWHRKIIYGWIMAVEREGPTKILEVENEVFRGKHSWRAVTLSIENYLKHAHAHIHYAAKNSALVTTDPNQPRLPPINPPALDWGVAEDQCSCCKQELAQCLLHPDDQSIRSIRHNNVLSSFRNTPSTQHSPTISTASLLSTPPTPYTPFTPSTPITDGRPSTSSGTRKPHGFIPPPLSADPTLVPPPLFSKHRPPPPPPLQFAFLSEDPNPSPEPSTRRPSSNWSFRGLRKVRSNIEDPEKRDSGVTMPPSPLTPSPTGEPAMAKQVRKVRSLKDITARWRGVSAAQSEKFDSKPKIGSPLATEFGTGSVWDGNLGHGSVDSSRRPTPTIGLGISGSGADSVKGGVDLAKVESKSSERFVREREQPEGSYFLEDDPLSPKFERAGRRRLTEVRSVKDLFRLGKKGREKGEES